MQKYDLDVIATVFFPLSDENDINNDYWIDMGGEIVTSNLLHSFAVNQSRSFHLIHKYKQYRIHVIVSDRLRVLLYPLL